MQITLLRKRHCSFILYGGICIGEVRPRQNAGFLLELYKVRWHDGWPNRRGGYTCVSIPRLKDTIPVVLDALHRLAVVDREGYYAL